MARANKYEYETIKKRVRCPICHGSGYRPNAYGTPPCDNATELGRCQGGKIFVYAKKRITPPKQTPPTYVLDHRIHRIVLPNGKKCRLVYPLHITREDLDIIFSEISKLTTDK